MFRYPVTIEEICLFLNRKEPVAAVAVSIEQLMLKKQVFRFEEFYLLHNDMSLVERRRKGNQHAENLLHIAYRIGSLLGRFPFVKAVGISGSLSKNYAEDDADIDFFIITAANRLWIARTLLHCLKKLSFLVGKQHWYCMNYFIDEDALLIAEENIFTATEVVTLKPVYGDSTMQQFLIANKWALDYLPNYRLQTSIISEDNAPWYKKLLQSLFNNRFGVWLDDYLMRVTAKRWKKKEDLHTVNVKGNPVGLMIGKHFARPNPAHFQKKLLNILGSKLDEIEEKYQLRFDEPHYFLRKEII
jgi:hypothetical protein